MTYKQKMEIEHPYVNQRFIVNSCPGHYLEGGPNIASASRCIKEGLSCVECWEQEIPGTEPVEKSEVHSNEMPRMWQ